jgi:hypothetical protein
MKKKFVTKLEKKLAARKKLLEFSQPDSDLSAVVIPVSRVENQSIFAALELDIQRNLEERALNDQMEMELLQVEKFLEFEEERISFQKAIDLEKINREARVAKLLHKKNFTSHAKERMVERSITVQEVLKGSKDIVVIEKGSTVITAFPNEKRLTEYLPCGPQKLVQQSWKKKDRLFKEKQVMSEYFEDA